MVTVRISTKHSRMPCALCRRTTKLKYSSERTPAYIPAAGNGARATHAKATLLTLDDLYSDE